MLLLRFLVLSPRTASSCAPPSIYICIQQCQWLSASGIVESCYSSRCESLSSATELYMYSSAAEAICHLCWLRADEIGVDAGANLALRNIIIRLKRFEMCCVCFPVAGHERIHYNAYIRNIVRNVSFIIRLEISDIRQTIILHSSHRRWI